MRISSLLLLIAIAAACTKPNEAVCCVSEADCARLGLDEPRPCEVGQACKAFACVAAECATSAECASPDAPVCIDGLCVASCRSDDDCAGAAGGPRCAADGACVGCLTGADCPATAPFCDADDRRCRGCAADPECASGVCLERDGRCAAEDEVIHVQMFGSDAGECTRAAPCRTLPYALQKVTPSRKVIHIDGGNLPTPATTIAIDRSVVIDGSDTTIAKPSGVPLFSLAAFLGPVTLEGVRLIGSADPSDPTITVTSGSLLRIARSVLSTALIDIVGGGLEVRDARVTAVGTMKAVGCLNGSVTVRAVDFEHTTIGAVNCHVNISRCRFDEISDGSIRAQGGVAIIENNLLINSYELADLMNVTSLAPGSVVRFNTFVNTSGIVADGIALSCDGSATVTSNIFAYGSTHPMGGPSGTPCPTRFSLFDAAAVAQHSGGEGNQTGDAATFFVNRAARDFHLSISSPARQAAEPGLSIDEDLEGHPRPAPLGSRSDAGCFEAP
jgi:hypothetical protein